MKKTKVLAVSITIVLLFACAFSQALASNGKVNINTASKEVLMTLKYVGDKIADRIIEYRQSSPFESPSDIMKVKGIGQKVFDANKELIIVQDE